MGLVIGTRPEAIKLAPVAHSLARAGAAVHLYFTGQHPGLEPAAHGLDAFPCTPLQQPGLPDPHEHVDRVANGLARIWKFRGPDMVMVQGDTSSALGGARAAVASRIPLAHVEAGLRSFDSRQPWPEEDFRIEIDRVSDLLFAPTSTSASNLISERCQGQVHITGNTGIDALLQTLGFRAKPPRHWPAGRFNILVTCHRRENWGDGFAAVSAALVELTRRPRIRIDVVLHPNPRVSEAMFEQLGHNASIRLLPPLSHAAMLEAMLRSDLILSDSGGVQEEAPTLGVPLLVLRDKTERPEGVEQGAMRLVGTDSRRIIASVDEIAGDRKLRASMSQQRFPFGDGQAAPRIAAAALQWLDREYRDRSEPRRA